LQWMELPGPTDVMSFPMDELRPGTDSDTPEGVLGDVVLCPSVARKQAAQAGHSVEDEILLLTTHGILHLLGFDHAEPAQEREMFDLQRTLLLTYLARRGRTTTAAPDARTPDAGPAPRPEHGGADVPSLVAVASVATLVAFLLSASETALLRVSRHRAAQLLEEDQRGAPALSKIVNAPAPYLAVAAFARVLAE